MNLTEYPGTIAKLQTRILAAAAQMRQHKESVSFCLNAIDRAIAFDESLKNEQQRKAKRSLMIETDMDYLASVRGQRQAEELLTKLEIELEQRRSEFSILKLQTRERIASLELQHAATA
jgi:polyribonucleotide nucleotidyltransferase